MAFETGTATNYLDMLSKLVSFLTTNATLAAANQVWSVVQDATPNDLSVAGLPANSQRKREIYLRGPGLDNTDQIYVNMRAYELPGSDYFNWQFSGASAFVGSAAFLSQPNASPPQHVYLWNQQIKYWLIGSGRRFVMVMKINNVYQALYCGFGLPTGRPSQYGYPLLIGGSGSSNNLRYSEQTVYNRSFYDGGNGYRSASLYMMWIDGSWIACGNWNDTTDSGAQANPGNGVIWPGISNLRAPNVMQDLNGNPPTYDCLIALPDPRKGVHMILDGLQFTPGFGTANEATFPNEKGNTMTVFQNVYRSENRAFMALECV